MTTITKRRRLNLKPTVSARSESTEPAVENGEEETEDGDDPEDRPSPRRN